MDALRHLQRDVGIGMTELAVAILVLGIVLVGLFPLMVDSIRLAQSNSDVGQANRAVATNIDLARTVSLGGTCASGTFSGTNPKGSLFQTAPSDFGGNVYFSCPDGAGKLVTVKVDVWKTASPSLVLSTATTKVIAG